MDEPNTHFYIKQGNLLRDLTGRFYDEETGEGVDLTGATLAFHMSHPITGTVLINAAAAIDGSQAEGAPTRGRFRYVWQPGQTDVDVGVYYGEVVAIFPGNRPLTGPNRQNFRIHVGKKLA